MIKSFSQALLYLFQSVPQKKDRFPGLLGLDRQKEILRLLDNPQNKIKVIHFAGTSGKGSSSCYLSYLLVSHGFKVGVTLSPHILDIRERFQINNKFISKKEFVSYLNQIIPVIEKIKTTHFGNPTYFEILIALSFFIFHQKKVDYAVVETGVGGLMDGTNVVTSENKIAVITRLGLDHTQILGSNISLIAAQKAGIIHPHNPVFSVHQITSAQLVLNRVAAENKTSVTYINSKINFKNIHLQKLSFTYDFNFQNLSLPKLKLNTIGLYQVQNSALALSVFKFISNRDNFIIGNQKIRSILSSIKFYGRADIYHFRNQLLILDGAHNPQKMAAFIKSLKAFFPGQKFTFILAFKKRKDFIKMIKSITPIANHIIITRFIVTSQELIQISEPIKNLIKIFGKIDFSSFEIIYNNPKALNIALKSNENVVITGSLYLLGEMYPLLKKINFILPTK